MLSNGFQILIARIVAESGQRPRRIGLQSHDAFSPIVHIQAVDLGSHLNPSALQTLRCFVADKYSYQFASTYGVNSCKEDI